MADILAFPPRRPAVDPLRPARGLVLATVLALPAWFAVLAAIADFWR